MSQNSRYMTKQSFYLETFANWKECNEVNFKAEHFSESGSQYMYTEEGVYRKANHWGFSVASCVWILDGKATSIAAIGFCKWEDFEYYGDIKITFAYREAEKKRWRKKAFVENKFGLEFLNGLSL